MANIIVIDGNEINLDRIQSVNISGNDLEFSTIDDNDFMMVCPSVEEAIKRKEFIDEKIKELRNE